MSKKRDYTKFSSAPAEPENVREVVEEVVEHYVEHKSGVVTDCIRLNVRKEPNTNAEVACVVGVAEDLNVFENESTEDFYKVRTMDGVEGYCMKRFVTINP